MELIVDGHHGVYVPQVFAQKFNNTNTFLGVDQEDYDILLKGPDDQTYWEVWESVLNNAHTADGLYLMQDGDLFLCKPGDEE